MPNTINIGGIDCTVAFEDFDNAVVEEVPPEGGPLASVLFQCNYANRYAVIKGLLGGITSSGRTINRIPPFSYPPSPNLTCLSIGQIKGLKPRWSNGFATYQTAIIPANFGIRKYQFATDDPAGQNDPSGKAWTKTKFRVSAEVFSPPGGAYYLGPFPAGKLVEEASVGIIRPRCEISMTRLMMPFVPLDEVMEVIGSVNDATVHFANHTFPRGTVLFAGMSSDPDSDPQGNPTQSIEYTMLGNLSVEWNEFMARDGTWQYLNTKIDGSGDPPYPYLDFSILP